MRLPHPHPDRGFFAVIVLSCVCAVACGDSGGSAAGHDEDAALSASDAGTQPSDFAKVAPEVLGSGIVPKAGARTFAAEDGGLEPVDFEPAARDVLGNDLAIAIGEAALEGDAGQAREP